MIFPTTIEKEGQYCILCYSLKVKRIFKHGLTYYYCSNCGKENKRSLVLDNKIKWWIDEKSNYWHESVGVIVKNGNNILCLKRNIYPFVWALPAGHLDINESPHEAACRELREETNISRYNIDLIDEFRMPNDSCRRGSDHHYWHLYYTNYLIDEIISLSDEAEYFSWLSFKEIIKTNNISHSLKYIIRTYRTNIFN